VLHIRLPFGMDGPCGNVRELEDTRECALVLSAGMIDADLVAVDAWTPSVPLA
jgi:hypothetical protein